MPEATKTTPTWVWIACLAILVALIVVIWPKDSRKCDVKCDMAKTQSTTSPAPSPATNNTGSGGATGTALVRETPAHQKLATDWHHAQHQTLTPFQANQRLRVPPEPYGHITDTEITSVSQPVDWRVWKNWDNYYQRESMNPNTYGSFFFPTKTGYYTNNFIQ